MIRVDVDLGERSYPVLVGPGVRHELAAVLDPAVRRVAIVTEEGLDIPVDPGRPHEVFEIRGGETNKTLATVEDLCRQFARWELTRADAVVGSWDFGIRSQPVWTWLSGFRVARFFTAVH